MSDAVKIRIPCPLDIERFEFGRRVCAREDGHEGWCMDYYALVIAEARDRYRAALEDIASLNGDAREQCADIARRALRGEQGEP